MTAEEVRKLAATMDEACKTPEMDKLSSEQKLKAMLTIVGTVAFSMICEAAAQLAEANEHLAKIANPWSTADQESLVVWTWLTSNGKPFAIDCREVTGVASLDTGIGSDHPTVVIGMKGQPWSKSADGTVEEICSKLGIPQRREK